MKDKVINAYFVNVRLCTYYIKIKFSVLISLKNTAELENTKRETNRLICICNKLVSRSRKNKEKLIVVRSR